ncbi:MAG TPA: hypothetical protein VGK18_15720 [Propionicimonas sp.]|jgi:hypothetical protein|uniref:hypothetical protein n=1 Tax=Propionicimonas sp. TaxID=1955623 RepID=UPI002F3EEFDF
MSAVQSPSMVVEPQPYFSALWLGRHPRDGEPRVVACFGPSAPEACDAEQAGVLGLQPVMLGGAPPLTPLRGDFDGERLVLHAGPDELLRTAPLPLPVAAVLQWRAEVLLVWVDLPLLDPRTELALIGLQHVWTGIAAVSGASLRRTATRASGALVRGRDLSNHCRTAPARRPA